MNQEANETSYMWAWYDGEGLYQNEADSLIDIMAEIVEYHEIDVELVELDDDTIKITSTETGETAIIGNNINEVTDWLNNVRDLEELKWKDLEDEFSIHKI